MTKCPECGKNMLVIVSANDKCIVYVCAACKAQVKEKKE